MNTLDQIESAYLRDDIPEFGPGDTVKVNVRVIEAGRERIQTFEGVVIGRSGGGIWLHGVLPGTETPIPRDTDGCIALNNAVLSSLAEVIDVQLTPLIVTRRIASATGRERARDELDGRVASWAASLDSGRLTDYLAHYDPGFSYFGLDLDDWSVLQFDALAAEEVAGVTVSDLFSAADPEEAGLYVTRFRLEVTLRDGSSRAQWKRLYWQRDDSGVLQIVAEDEA